MQGASNRDHDRLGGFRLVRRLGADAAAEVHLAVPVAGGTAVAVKIPAPGVAQAEVLGAADAMWRARGPHVVRLLDAIDRGDAAPALVLDRVEIALSSVLAAGRLAPSAAATVLVPVASAVRSMHAAGVAHGAIGPATIRLDARGAPVVSGFGRASRFEPGGSRVTLAGTASAVADALAVRALAMGLFAEGDSVRRLAELGDESSVMADPEAWLERLETAVFDWVEPGPVPIESLGVADGAAAVATELRPRRSERSRSRAGEVIAAGPTTSAGPPLRPRAGRRSRPPSAPVSLAGVLDGVGARAASVVADRLPRGMVPGIQSALEHLRSRVGGIRARVWIPAAVVLVALIGAIVLVPVDGGDPAPAAPLAPSAHGVASSSPTDAPLGDVADPTEAAEPTAAIDPESAALKLMAARSACLGERDAACLDDVLQADGPAQLADLVAIAAEDVTIEAATWRPTEAVLVDLLGGAALVNVELETSEGVESVPVLLVRSGDRWLIRTVLGDSAGQER